MRNSIDELLKNPVSFLADAPADEDIAISTRIRLARNLGGRAFPVAASVESCREVCDLVSDAAASSGALGCPECFSFDPGDLTGLDREILLERRLASREFIAKPEGTRLLVREDESCSIMINEEDQLRIQSLRPGLELDAVWESINRLDDELGSRLDYAFDSKLGYLTSCPTNVGTGMRASVMLHLPGLVLTRQIGPAMQGVGKLNLAVRGIFGEGSDNLGNLFQISNQSTLGESERQIIDHLKIVIGQIVSHEKAARRRLLETDRFGTLDHVGRAYGVLLHSYKLSSEEALQCLSGVRFGVDMRLFAELGIHQVNELFIATNPAHLQKSAGCALEEAERDIRRAALCRDKLKPRPRSV